MADRDEVFQLILNHRKISKLWEANLQKVKDKLQESEVNALLCDESEGKKKEKEQIKPDPSLLSRLENLLQTEENTFTGLLTDIFGSNHKEELILETLCKLNGIKYDAATSIFCSKDYRDKLAGADGTENFVVQMGSDHMSNEREKHMDRLAVLKDERATNLLNLLEGKAKHTGLDILNRLQDLAVEIGIKVSQILILLLFPMKKVRGLTRKKFNMFTCFLNQQLDSSASVMFIGVNNALKEADFLLTEWMYGEDYEASWDYSLSSDEKLDAVLRELGVFILNVNSVLHFNMLSTEPSLMLRSLSFVEEYLEKMKNRLTYEAKNMNTEDHRTGGRKTLEEEVMEVNEYIADGLKEFLYDAIKDANIDFVWKKLVFVEGPEQKAEALRNFAMALGFCLALILINNALPSSV